MYVITSILSVVIVNLIVELERMIITDNVISNTTKNSAEKNSIVLF